LATQLIKSKKQTKTIQDLFIDAIEFDVPYLAYLIYFVVQKGKLNMNESDERLDTIELSPSEQIEFDQMRTQDFLKLRQIQLYAVKQKNNYIFYFGHNAIEVATYHKRLYRQKVRKLTNCHNQMMDKSLYFPETKQTKTFRELLKETHQFPCYICEMERDAG